MAFGGGLLAFRTGDRAFTNIYLLAGEVEIILSNPMGLSVSMEEPAGFGRELNFDLRRGKDLTSQRGWSEGDTMSASILTE